MLAIMQLPDRFSDIDGLSAVPPGVSQSIAAGRPARSTARNRHEERARPAPHAPLRRPGGPGVVGDNDRSADGHRRNLLRVIDECGGSTGLIEFFRVQGRLLCDVAASLSESARPVPIPVLIISGGALIVDERWSLDELVGGVGLFHLPRHAELAGLR